MLPYRKKKKRKQGARPCQSRQAAGGVSFYSHLIRVKRSVIPNQPLMKLQTQHRGSRNKQRGGEHLKRLTKRAKSITVWKKTKTRQPVIQQRQLTARLPAGPPSPRNATPARSGTAPGFGAASPSLATPSRRPRPAAEGHSPPHLHGGSRRAPAAAANGARGAAAILRCPGPVYSQRRHLEGAGSGKGPATALRAPPRCAHAHRSPPAGARQPQLPSRRSPRGLHLPSCTARRCTSPSPIRELGAEPMPSGSCSPSPQCR